MTGYRPATLAGVILQLLGLAACDAAPDDRPGPSPPPAAAAAGAAGAAVAPADDPAAAALVADGAAATAGFAARPEALSLLGQPLYPLPAEPAVEARLQAQLDSAESAYAARPGNTDAIIWLGRRQAYLGRYRDAIETFTEGIERHRDEPRFYRHRGHRWITVRELDRAVEDLEHAARLVSGHDDVVEPDGQPNAAGIPRSTLHTNIWYHLGLARYLQGDFEGAAHAFRNGLAISPNDDMRVAMANWLWLSLRRLGRDAEADAVLEPVAREMDILENESYHRLLLLYKGELDRDTLVPPRLYNRDDGAAAGPRARGRSDPAAERAIADRATGDAASTGPGPVTLATYGYGLAAWHLLRGDRLRARTELERVLETGQWPAFGYIAAEAELIALGDGPPRSDTVGAMHRFDPPER